MSVVAGGGEVGDALTCDRVDGLGYQAILEERLVRVAHIVVNDLGAGVRERGNTVCEVSFTVDGRVEGQAGTRCDGVNDLQNRPTFIGEGQLIRLTVIEAGG